VLATPLPPVLTALTAALDPHRPPEPLTDGDWTGTAQVYAVAALLRDLLAGHDDVPVPVLEVLRAALAADPDRRPADPVALADRLALAASEAENETSRPPAAAARPRADAPRPLGSRYWLDTPIGRGATGHVWAGRRREDDSPVAVKLLRAELAADPGVVNRFLRERLVLTGLRHPHLVRVHDLVAEGEVLGIVMDLVEGEDLRKVVKRGPLPLTGAATLLAQVAGALAAVHAADLVHRDVKPENVLVAPGPTALLTDFGIARAVAGSAHTELIGTPSYVAPELVMGRPPTPACDVYALGVTAYELLTGRKPFTGGTSEAILRAHLDQPVQRPGDVDPAAWDLVSASLARQPQDRPDAAEVARGWSRLAGLPEVTGPPAAPRNRVDSDDGGGPDGHTGTALSARPVPVRPAEERPQRRRRGRAVAVAAAVALGVAGGAGVAVWHARGTPHAAPPAVPTSAPASAARPYLVPATVKGRTLRWGTRATGLPGFAGYVVLDERARPVSDPLSGDVTSYTPTNLKPGKQSCFLVLALGVSAAPDDPPAQPACVTP
jgi:serine/threonine-protein kinase